MTHTDPPGAAGPGESGLEAVETAAEMDDAPATSSPGRHPMISVLIRIAQLALVAAIVGAIGWTIKHQWDDVSRTFRSLAPLSIAAAIVAVVLGMFCGVRAWQHLLLAVGIKVPYLRSAQINLVGALGKYLPGSVWSFMMQAQLGLRYGITRSKSLVALLLQTGLSILAAMLISLVALPAFLDKWGNIAWLLLLAPLGLIFLHPKVLTWVAQTALRVLRRGHLEVKLPAREILLAFVWSIITWLFFGLHLWILVNSLGEPGWRGYLISVGAMALAMSAGFIAFVLPSGIGVREVVIVAGLSPLLSTGPALAVALCSRLLFTFADIAAAVVAASTARAALRRENEAHQVTQV